MSTKSDAVEALGAIGTLFAALFIIVSCVALGICIYGTGVWLVWNYALVPLCGVAPLTFFTSCALGVGVSIVSSMVFRRKSD